MAGGLWASFDAGQTANRVWRQAMSHTGFDGCAVLREHSAFDRLPLPLMKWLSSRARLQLARQDEVIFSRDDPGRSFYLVAQGAVKICVISAEGREAVFTIAHRGDSFGEIAVLDGSTRTANAIAKADCKLMVIDRNDLLHVMAANPHSHWRSYSWCVRGTVGLARSWRRRCCWIFPNGWPRRYSG